MEKLKKDFYFNSHCRAHSFKLKQFKVGDVWLEAIKVMTQAQDATAVMDDAQA